MGQRTGARVHAAWWARDAGWVDGWVHAARLVGCRCRSDRAPIDGSEPDSLGVAGRDSKRAQKGKGGVGGSDFCNPKLSKLGRCRGEAGVGSMLPSLQAGLLLQETQT